MNQPLFRFWRRWWGLRLAARGDHVGALSASRDAEVLSRLGLHLAVLRAPVHQRLMDRVVRALAKAELGDISCATGLLAVRDQLSNRDRTRLVLTVGRWDPSAALTLSANAPPDVRAALAWRAAEFATSDRLITAEQLTDSADTALLRASCAAWQGDHLTARLLANSSFSRFGLEAPLDETPAPITLAALRSRMPERHVSAPRVSVVMPVKSMAGTVETALRSVLAQRGVAVDVIVVDDASTDETPQRVGVIANADPRVVLHLSPTSIGTYAARNVGLTFATSPFIAFNDADDWSHPERLLRQLKPLLTSSTVMATESRMVRLDADGYFVSPRIYPLIRANRSSLLFRRQVLDRLGGFEQVSVGADEEFTARIRACFGPASVRQLALPLAIGLQSDRSLTGALATGIGTPAGMRARIEYREAWMQRHVTVAKMQTPDWTVLPKQRS